MTTRFVSAGAMLLSTILLAMPAAAVGRDSPATVALTAGDIRVVDGDTVRVLHERIRFLEIDAPEISEPRCAAELSRGMQARNRLQQLIVAAARLDLVTTGERDKYHRPLGILRIDGHDAGEILLREGLAVPWRPGRSAWEERARHWCPGWQRPPGDNP